MSSARQYPQNTSQFSISAPRQEKGHCQHSDLLHGMIQDPWNVFQPQQSTHSEFPPPYYQGSSAFHIGNESLIAIRFAPLKPASLPISACYRAGNQAPRQSHEVTQDAYSHSPHTYPRTFVPSHPNYAESESHGYQDHDSIDNQVLSQALAFTRLAPPPSSSTHQLPSPSPSSNHRRPRPSLHPSLAPTLQNHNITPESFLAFIDGLNIVLTANPPLQVLNLAGSFLSMVPHHWAAIAGGVIQATAQVGTAVVSKGRTEMYLKEVNASFFAPRGLKVRIASREAVGVVLGIPEDQPVIAPLSRETMAMSSVERALLAVEPYCSVLDFDVPPPAEQTTVLAKMSAKQVERLGKKNGKKVMKERDKALRKEEKAAEKAADGRKRKERRIKKRREIKRPNLQ